MENFDFLNGLRGLAAILVVYRHANVFDESIGDMGANAVDIFFILSAFLLTSRLYFKVIDLYSKASTSAKTWIHLIVDYYIRRIMRIYPLFFVHVILVSLMPSNWRSWVTAGWFKPGDQFPITEILYFRFDEAQNINRRYGVLWSLPVEIMYYNIIPLYVFCVALCGKRGWLLSVIVLAGCVYYTNTLYRSYVYFLPHLPTFLVGSSFGILYCFLVPIAKKLDFSSRKVQVLHAINYILVLFVFSQLSSHVLYSWYLPLPDKSHAWVDPSTRFLLGTIIVKELLFPSYLTDFFSHILFIFCGKISFSMYIWHWLIVHKEAFVNYKKDVWDTHFFWIIGVLIVSCLSYYLIEAPFQKVTRWICRHVKIWIDYYGNIDYMMLLNQISGGYKKVNVNANDIMV